MCQGGKNGRWGLALWRLNELLVSNASESLWTDLVSVQLFSSSLPTVGQCSEKDHGP